MSELMKPPYDESPSPYIIGDVGPLGLDAFSFTLGFCWGFLSATFLLIVDSVSNPSHIDVRCGV